jgi:membrane protein implicated in regulation of membrane protease activity
MKEFWLYTLLRIGIFLAWVITVIAVWALVAGSVPVMWAVVIAFALSGITSYFLLARQREALARRVEVRAQRMSAAFEESRAKEDVD